jgi:hypothetical protein
VQLAAGFAGHKFNRILVGRKYRRQSDAGLSGESSRFLDHFLENIPEKTEDCHQYHAERITFQKEEIVLFGGKLKNFFDWLEADYLNHIDWKLFVAALALIGAISLFRFLKRGIRCPQCGSELLLHVHDNEQFDRWFCECGYEKIHHFN